ncbi:hypothetical protein BV22DRAFT_1197603 [Leucogyrophana mollusca]|uniref:Uncharacterized protein n=1 Tax=Leucogyrophana mollusca TaxID=85980 RepID=A0ACB8B9S4_9AGAM|nr:hypothetical protein BV22DRAFT_1197603 [Leucogyrophana mollusca]
MDRQDRRALKSSPPPLQVAVVSDGLGRVGARSCHLMLQGRANEAIQGSARDVQRLYSNSVLLEVSSSHLAFVLPISFLHLNPERIPEKITPESVEEFARANWSLTGILQHAESIQVSPIEIAELDPRRLGDDHLLVGPDCSRGERHLDDTVYWKGLMDSSTRLQVAQAIAICLAIDSSTQTLPVSALVEAAGGCPHLVATALKHFHILMQDLRRIPEGESKSTMELLTATFTFSHCVTSILRTSEGDPICRELFVSRGSVDKVIATIHLLAPKILVLQV